MADSIREVNWLRYYYTSDDAVKDKDLLKDQAHVKLTHKVNALFLVPTAFQFWHLSLMNHPAQRALCQKVRWFKIVSLIGATAVGSYELLNMRKKWDYYDHFYPEPTELQKTLNRDALIFRENGFKPETSEQKLAKLQNPELTQIYGQMYQLPPQRYNEPDDDPNAPTMKEHDRSQ